MQDEEFEWDDIKASANMVRHRLTFDAARAAFQDPFSVGWVDEREAYGEVRYVVLGMANNRLVNVVYTMRNDRIRIISARGADPRERRTYHEQDA